jgi:hypothetical protein
MGDKRRTLISVEGDLLDTEGNQVIHRNEQVIDQ